MGRTMTTRRLVPLVLLMAVVLALGVAGNARATSENRPPILTAETNLDEDGNIRVHEQGTVDVQLVGSTVDLLVDDSEPLDVELASASAGLLGEIRDLLAAPGGTGVPQAADAVRFFDFSMDSSILTTQVAPRLLEMDPILATTLLISAENDELIVEGFNGEPDESDQVFSVGHGGMGFPNTLAVSFPAPVPMDLLGIWCGNESEDCEISISVIGYEPTS